MALISRSTQQRRARLRRRATRLLRVTLRRRYSARECLDGIARLAGLAVILVAIFLSSGSMSRPGPKLVRYTIRVTTVPGDSPERVAISRLAGRWTTDVISAARRYDVPATLVASVLHEENRGYINDCAHRVSSAGAIGPLQLMPGTAWKTLRVNPWNPRENIRGGTRYLASLIRHYHGNVRQALMAYNAGPTAVDAGRVPIASIRYASDIIRRAARTNEQWRHAPGRMLVSRGVIAM